MAKGKQIKKAIKALAPAAQPLNDANADKQPGAAEQAPKFQAFLIVGFKGGETGSKVVIKNIEDGKDLLKEIFVAISTGKPFYDEERGLVYNGFDISHAFLTLEAVKG